MPQTGVSSSLPPRKSHTQEEVTDGGCIQRTHNPHGDSLYGIDVCVRRVTNGEIYDMVLSFMIKQGLMPLQILDNYVEDEESLHKAVLVEWRNPNIYNLTG